MELPDITQRFPEGKSAIYDGYDYEEKIETERDIYEKLKTAKNRKSRHALRVRLRTLKNRHYFYNHAKDEDLPW